MKPIIENLHGLEDNLVDEPVRIITGDAFHLIVKHLEDGQVVHDVIYHLIGHRNLMTIQMDKYLFIRMAVTIGLEPSDRIVAGQRVWCITPFKPIDA